MNFPGFGHISVLVSQSALGTSGFFDDCHFRAPKRIICSFIGFMEWSMEWIKDLHSFDLKNYHT